MTDVQARAKAFELLALLQTTWGGFDRWLRQLSADEQEDLVLDIITILQRHDAP